MQSLKKILINGLMFLGLSFGLTMLALASSSLDRAKELADQGDPDYQLLLGYYYESGEEVRQDYAEAVKWYRKAAEQGLAPAQVLLGFKYTKGLGVRQDYAQAIKWYRKAAEQENSEAQYNLGVVYYSGRGVRQDYTEAKEWFGKSCDNGDQAGCDEYRNLNQKQLNLSLK